MLPHFLGKIEAWLWQWSCPKTCVFNAFDVTSCAPCALKVDNDHLDHFKDGADAAEHGGDILATAVMNGHR
jgi:hypothetical protein